MPSGVHGSVAPCGTYAGYQAHKRLGTPKCADCRRANTDAATARRNRLKPNRVRRPRRARQ